MSIVLQGSTSGSITLQEPAVAGSTVLDLPARSGTIMVNGPAFSATNNNAQSISNATTTKVQFQVENFDTANCFDSTTNYRFTPNVAGYYQINAAVYMYSNASGKNMSYTTFIYKNGSIYLRQQATLAAVGFNDYSGALSDEIYLNGSTDYLEVYVNITDLTSSGGGEIANGSQYVRFSGSMTRAA